MANEQTDGLEVVIKLGDAKLPGALPFIPTRFRVSSAFYTAAGWREGDVERGEGPTGEPDADDIAAIFAASIGLCWPGATPWGKLRNYDRDVIDYGEAVMDNLIRRGHSQASIIDEGRRLCELIRTSVPTVEEVSETEAGFTSPAGSSTGSTAGSG
jgi:hypothetical protein